MGTGGRHQGERNGLGYSGGCGGGTISKTEGQATFDAARQHARAASKVLNPGGTARGTGSWGTAPLSPVPRTKPTSARYATSFARWSVTSVLGGLRVDSARPR